MRPPTGFKRTEVLARPRKQTMRAYQGISTMGAAHLRPSSADPAVCAEGEFCCGAQMLGNLGSWGMWLSTT